MVLVAHIDDSRDDEAFVLGGYLSGAEEWKALSDDWMAVLSHPPAIKAFKMSQLHMTDPNEVERLRLAHRAISKNLRTGVSVAFSTRDYMDVFGRSQYNSPFFIAYLLLLLGTAKMQSELGLNERVDFIFDEQNGEDGNLLGVLDRARERGNPEWTRYLGAPPLFRNGEDFVALQAGDFFAWWSREALEKPPKQRA